MDFSKYNNTLSYHLNDEETHRLKNIELKFSKGRKPEEMSHSEYGKILDALEAEKIVLEEKRKEIRVQYRTETIRLETSFWEDSFEELGLTDLPAEIKTMLRHKAWEDGHSDGYSSVFNHLNEYVEIVEACKMYLK